MFSATFNKTCRQVAKKYLEHGYVRIRVGRLGSSHANIEQRVSTNDTICFRYFGHPD